MYSVHYIDHVFNSLSEWLDAIWWKMLPVQPLPCIDLWPGSSSLSGESIKLLYFVLLLK